LRDLPEQVVLLVAGGRHPQDESDYAERLAERIDALGLGARVVVTGYLPPARMATALAASDVVLAPYRGVVGASGSLLLAVAHGVPVLAWDLPPLRELAERFDGIELFPSDALAPLRRRVEALLESPAEVERLRARVRRASRGHGFEQEADRVRAVYAELLAAPRRRRRSDAGFRWPRALLRAARGGAGRPGS
jgi:glycosyltransferase involved in cell wall biosynthesis